MTLTPRQAAGLRKSLRLTQFEICKLLHIGAKNWSRYENGKSNPPQCIILLCHLLEQDFTLNKGRTFKLYLNT